MIRLRSPLRTFAFVLLWSAQAISATPPTSPTAAELGRAIFFDASLSVDGQISCATCHKPDHAFADTRERSIGSGAHTGTRNAPSLIGIGNATAFFWDGRRSHLEDAVLDATTNPADLGLTSTDDLVARLRRQPEKTMMFSRAFGVSSFTERQVAMALVAYINSLDKPSSAYAAYVAGGTPLSSEAEHGRKLFEGVAGCAECHRIDNPNEAFTDGQYHFSTVGNVTASPGLLDAISKSAASTTDPRLLGRIILVNAEQSALGRFNVTHDAADIGAFRTPSLRNVAVTGPYMHDGSIAALSDVVDHEIYYRGIESGRPVNLSTSERLAVVAFLNALTDQSYRLSELPAR